MTNYSHAEDLHFIRFIAPIGHIPLPERFTFPFSYTPHALSLLASKELRQYIQEQKSWEHNFGLNPDAATDALGKMFGILVVQNNEGEIGYLAAFSGKLNGKNKYDHFVPSIFDALDENGFYKAGERELNQINAQVIQLENAPAYLACKAQLDKLQALADKEYLAAKKELKLAKKLRHERRSKAKDLLPDEEYDHLLKELEKQSFSIRIAYKNFLADWRQRLEQATKEVEAYALQIAALKDERKRRSGALQQRLFDQYHFLNQTGATKSLIAIFENTQARTPPSGAGDCAAPKLLQYAFRYGYKPLAMAEFWWGKSPSSAIRKHGYFYPACRGKCEPILGHMLSGMLVDPNPMLQDPAVGKELEIVYEDEALAVINKPAEFLSVPGKNVMDSVYQRMRNRYPNATGPLIVHRLDMSTSGLLLIAKDKEVHKLLQSQFIERTVNKRYVALLDGAVVPDGGVIDLPLRVDLNDRPRQLVCYEHGKTAQTKWEVIERRGNRTKVYFYPITGRTHQLRVHSAYHLGLNAPIVGDDLYGKRDTRLHLHAECISFVHPASNELVTFTVEADF